MAKTSSENAIIRTMQHISRETGEFTVLSVIERDNGDMTSISAHGNMRNGYMHLELNNEAHYLSIGNGRICNLLDLLGNGKRYLTPEDDGGVDHIVWYARYLSMWG